MAYGEPNPQEVSAVAAGVPVLKPRRWVSPLITLFVILLVVGLAFGVYLFWNRGTPIVTKTGLTATLPRGWAYVYYVAPPLVPGQGKSLIDIFYDAGRFQESQVLTMASDTKGTFYTSPPEGTFISIRFTDSSTATINPDTIAAGRQAKEGQDYVYPLAGPSVEGFASKVRDGNTGEAIVGGTKLVFFIFPAGLRVGKGTREASIIQSLR
jgi:hypothetical protein